MTDVLCKCRCGVCCKEMAIRADAADAVREPRIAAEANAIVYDEQDRPSWYLLNVLDTQANDGLGPCVFLRYADSGEACCDIHATRPAVCRLVDCDQLQELALRVCQR